MSYPEKQAIQAWRKAKEIYAAEKVNFSYFYMFFMNILITNIT